MSMEDAILKLAAAIEANTAARLGGAAAPSAAPAADKPAGKGKAKDTPAPAAPAASKVDRSMVNAALEKVKDEKGVEAAKKIISTEGGATKRADIGEDKFQAVYDACEAALAAEEEM